jgi:hypothetical protein
MSRAMALLNGMTLGEPTAEITIWINARTPGESDQHRESSHVTLQDCIQAYWIRAPRRSEARRLAKGLSNPFPF